MNVSKVLSLVDSTHHNQLCRAGPRQHGGRVRKARRRRALCLRLDRPQLRRQVPRAWRPMGRVGSRGEPEATRLSVPR